MRDEAKRKIKEAASEAGSFVLDALRQSVFADEDEAMLAAANAEWELDLGCAAAVLVETKVPDSKITALLKKYFHCDDEQATTALGKGRIMVEKKAFVAKSRGKIARTKGSEKK